MVQLPRALGMPPVHFSLPYMSRSNQGMLVVAQGRKGLLGGGRSGTQGQLGLSGAGRVMPLDCESRPLL